MARTLKLDDLEVGMVLVAEVSDRNGRLLMPSGGTLTAKHLRVFKTWGVADAQVEGEDDSAVPPPAEDSILDLGGFENAEEAAKELFRHADLDHPFMQALFREAVLRMARDSGGDDGA